MESSASSYPVSKAVDVQDDNPCWGSTTQCDLKHLLSKIKKENVIRYESTNYIVLSKPPDLRMDGPYRATVHKLLTYWYPPPSIVPGNCHVKDDKDDKLLETISKLHQHNNLADNQLRPCHQLDYATSGILCVARSRETANFAIRQWEDRKVTKTYLALLEGTLSLDNSNKPTDTTTASSSPASLSWPILTSEEMQTKIQQLEDSYRAKKRRQQKMDATKSNATTFQGFQPASSLFQKYKSSVIQKSKNSATAEDGSNNDSGKKKKRKRSSLLTESEWEQVWEPVREIVSDDGIVSMNWKGIGSQQNEWKEAFIDASEIHNGILRKQHLASEAEKLSASTLPTIFRVEGDPTSVYIYCPLADVRDEFTMKVPPNIIQDYPQLGSLVTNNTPFSGGDDDELDFKPSLTKCSLIQTATYHNNKENIPVTKVKLWPITGRRHQLRVHTALLGHSILGDKTYSSSIQSADDDEVTKWRRDLSPRMCLHACSLRLKLLVADDKNESNATATSSDSGKLVEVTAQDPFLVDDDGKLVLNML